MVRIIFICLYYEYTIYSNMLNVIYPDLLDVPLTDTTYILIAIVVAIVAVIACVCDDNDNHDDR